MAGFGSVGGAPQSGITLPENVPNINDDMHAIRERYVLPTVNNPQTFSLAANRAMRFDLRMQTLNALLITVQSGVLFGYFGDFMTNDNRTPTTPHFIVSAGVVPGSQTIPLPPDDTYIITLQEGAAGTVIGCLTPQAL